MARLQWQQDAGRKAVIAQSDINICELMINPKLKTPPVGLMTDSGLMEPQSARDPEGNPKGKSIVAYF